MCSGVHRLSLFPEKQDAPHKPVPLFLWRCCDIPSKDKGMTEKGGLPHAPVRNSLMCFEHEKPRSGVLHLGGILLTNPAAEEAMQVSFQCFQRGVSVNILNERVHTLEGFLVLRLPIQVTLPGFVGPDLIHLPQSTRGQCLSLRYAAGWISSDAAFGFRQDLSPQIRFPSIRPDCRS